MSTPLPAAAEAALHSPWRRAGVLLSVVALVALSAVRLAEPATARTSGSGDAVSTSKTVTRSYLDSDGASHTIDSRRVELTVSQTTNLRGRQELGVSWSGAHPTGGLYADINSGDAMNEEYPFVLLQCRGVDSAAHPISPETCWTQTSQERYQDYSDSYFPPWRVDRYADAADRAAVVDQPANPGKCTPQRRLAVRYVPFRAADGTVYPGGPGGCAGVAPEASDVSGAGLPSNTTYGVTAADGRGSAQFDLFTSDENASLGCTDKVACSLVAIPIEGISCDTYGHATAGVGVPTPDKASSDDKVCRETGFYKPGDLHAPGELPDLAVSGALWWSASNWRNRISVPLRFSPSASVCSVTGGAAALNIYGSVPFAEASAQWQPAFCTVPGRSPYTHVQTSDPGARALLQSGSIEAALGSEPLGADFGRPAVQAPIATSGFAISYLIDDNNGQRYGKLRLDARLLAKLLTQSYLADPDIKANYTYAERIGKKTVQVPAMRNNPLNITQDPEFQALNPDVPKLTYEAAAELINISSESDVIYALTSYINADPEARAFLDGYPDPWGMVVNPNYRHIALPVTTWTLLDGYTPTSTGGQNICFDNSPSPWLNLVANPTVLMSTVALDVQFGLSNVSLICNATDPTDTEHIRLVAQGRQQPGHRFVIGLTSLGEAARYSLNTAALQTTNTSSDRDAQFDDAAGRTFVAPTSAGLRAATDRLVADQSAGAWRVNYAAIHSGTGAAYPGTMMIYADVPTRGLPKSDAARLAQFLRFAAGPGQQAGLGNGELPPGYLPMTRANGLEAEVDYTQRAAAAVAAQTGEVPALLASASSRTGQDSGASTSGGGGTGAAAAPAATGTSGSANSQAAAVKVRADRSSAASVAPAGRVDYSMRLEAGGSSLGAWLLPILALLSLLAALLAPLTRHPELARRPALLLTTLLPRGKRRGRTS